MANEFLSGRTAVGTLIPTGLVAAATQYSGAMVPAGAIITGIRIVPTAAVVKTNASQTVVLNVGTQALCATVNISTLPAETVVATTALTAVSGIYVSAMGELNAVFGATGTSTASGTWYYYVDYIYVPA
jgi:hypothetical protein